MGPGWFRDPSGHPFERWWDGIAWSPHTRPLPPQSRSSDLGRIVGIVVAVLGFVAAIVFMLFPVTEHVFGTDIKCGGTGFEALTVSADSGVSDGFSDAIANECHSDGRTHVMIAAGVLIGGLIIGSVIIAAAD